MTYAMISYHTQNKQGPRTKIETLKKRKKTLLKKKHKLFSSSALNCTQDFCFLRQSCCLFSNNETLNKNQLNNKNKFQVFYVLFEAREREEEINSRPGMCVGRERREG